MAKKGQKLSEATRQKISEKAAARLRGTDGKFITKEKQATIIELAAANGLPPSKAQEFIYQNESALSGYLERGNVEATFSSKNYVSYLSNNFNKFIINGEKVSRKKAILLLTQVQNYLSRELGSNMNLFNGYMTDITPEGSQTLVMNLPIKKTKTKRKKYRVDREMVEDMDGDDIEILYKQFD